MGNTKSKSIRRVKASKSTEIQERNPISISPEVLADVLTFYSRKNLLQLCQVNSLFFQIGNKVPSAHIVRNICFGISDSGRYLKSSPHLIQLVLPRSQTISQIPLKELPIPLPFIRFREVKIAKLLENATLNFLLRAKKSFKGSRLNIAIEGKTSNSGKDLKIQDQINNLLEEIFVECSHIQIDSRFMEPQKVAKTMGVLNCDRLELQFYSEQICNSDTSKALMTWLNHKEGHPKARRHLLLKNYPRVGIMETIEELKRSFQAATQPVNYVVTFIECRESADKCIEKNMDFDLENSLTGEQLSFFDHYPAVGRGLRLWRRLVTDKDDAFFALLAGECGCVIPEGFDHDFYDVNYKMYYQLL
ncbi:hypothetical protein DdX_16195 [Ditylenchus destructor]|uniref:Uncharacterized protein n=1 Tax=Ditylenchus destructor TaxID=166010 RepID=A0AAD4MRD2_9BILA|nr:hypothetical protein DdX_16195 [Ditylenchus destructor]